MSTKPSNKEVLELYAKKLEQALADEETRESLEERSAEGYDVSVKKVHQELLANPAPALAKVQTMRKGWEGAEKRLKEARRARLRGIGKPFLVLLLAGAALALLSYLTLPSRIRWAAIYPLILPLLPFYARMLDFRVRVRRRDRREARARFLQALETQTMVTVREASNRRLTSFSTTFEIFDRRGLRQLSDPDREVSVAAVEELESLITSLDSGSIGLSGPRGSGKTTVIDSFTRGPSMPFNKERLGLAVAAPVKYDPREFVLHLFASLCEEVLSERPGELARSGTHWAYARRRRVLLLSGPLAIFLLAAGFYLAFGLPSLSEELLMATAFSLGAFAAYLWLLAWFFGTAAGRKAASRMNSALGIEARSATAKVASERAAKEYLKQIRFQQSQDKSGSVKIGFFGIELGGGSTTSLTRSAWTLPEAVEELRRFVSSLRHRFVVIGIDELDKMESDQSAREFLNNVKGVFGVPGCYFLVSVSEDAMSAFERRGLPLRDVFDSSFDEIQRIGYLSLAESRRVLESRVTGLPVPFQCLCHCLAAGLPRDLIRVTRELVHEHDVAKKTAKEAGAPFDPSLRALAGALIKAELRGKLAAAIASSRSSEQAQPWWLTHWLHEQELASPQSAGLRDMTIRLGDSRSAHSGDQDPDARKALRIATEMMAFNYYAATVLDLFGSDFIAPILEDPEKPNGVDIGGAWTVETLASARQQFSIDPWLSWGLIERVRSSTGLEVWRDLRPAAR